MNKKINSGKLKLSLIGGGLNSTIGTTHFLASQLDKRFEIVSGCFSRNYKINQNTGKRWSINKGRIYKDWKHLIDNEKKVIDAFVVLTPTPNHYSILKKLINENFPIICEKPLTSNLKEIITLKKEFRKFKNFLSVTYNYTGYPMVREIKEIVKKGKIGKILNINFEMPQETFLKKNIKKVKIQKWRLKDQIIPTICLDLGIHLYNLSYFILGKNPKKIISDFSNLGIGNNIIDDVKIWLEYKDDMKGIFWISKSAIGNRNGLRLEIFGTKGSIVWKQTIPEEIKLSYSNGTREIVDRSSKTYIASQKRYNRYSAGHPAGFIEAFANSYYDIADALIAHKKNIKKNNQYVFNFNHSLNGLKFLDAACLSNKKKKWLSIKF